MMISYQEFADNCARLEERVARAALACGRDPAEIKILPVTKTHSHSAVEYAVEYGFVSVGENRVQEVAEKMPQSPEVQWELIGHLQTNKVAKAVELFARIQSVDSEKLLQKLNASAEKLGKNLRVLLQINAGNDPAKFGADPTQASTLLNVARNCSNLTVEGLMTIAPLDSDLDTASRCFANLRKIRDELSSEFKLPLNELSMGMSGDLERAVAEGSTMIRVGTFLFGSRK